MVPSSAFRVPRSAFRALDRRQLLRVGAVSTAVSMSGWLGKVATPLLICQLKPRLGISQDDLSPIAHAKTVSVPKFFIAGTTDRDTTIDEAKAMFAAAAAPKQSWWVEGAAHVDMCRFAGSEYQKRVLAFLAKNLK